MFFSKRTQYGVRAMVRMAEAYQRGYVRTHDLTRDEGLPAKFLESIMATLTRARLLQSKMGASGGYRLARDPEKITLGEIVRPLEGQRLEFDEKKQADRELLGAIAVQAVQLDASRALQSVLDAMTLQDLLERATQQIDTSPSYMI